MIVDLHSHYPMHIAAELGKADTLGEMTRGGRHRIRDRFRALVLDIVSRLLNYETPHAGPGVTVPLLREGRVGVALSVLYCPFSEMDLEQPYAAPPLAAYMDDLLQLIDHVERDIATKHPTEAVVAHCREEMNAALLAGKVALVHAVEGGFHLGGTDAEIETNVEKLSRIGVAYITVAHLFWRQIATNCPALPFLPDQMYRLLFSQPADVGLDSLGKTMVRAMAAHRVLVDVTHMSERSMADTFDLFDEIDPGRKIPVIASHIACRFGPGLAYNLEDEWIRKISARGGVMGVILCDHYTRDGILEHATRNFHESMAVIFRQIDRILDVTSSEDHVAIGTDLDGFIKPTLSGLQNAAQLSPLEDALTARYSVSLAKKICSGNALRVLEYWREHP